MPIIFYDVTEISRLNRKTGIQRVTWEIFQALEGIMSLGPWRIEPVIGDADSNNFYKADVNKKEENFLAGFNEIPIHPSSFDIFLGVDLHYKIKPELVSVLDGYRSNGCSIFFVVHDILPVTHPELFSVNDKWFGNEDFLAQFAYWLTAAATLSSALISVSSTTQFYVETWLDRQLIFKDKRPRLAKFRLGSNKSQRFEKPPTTRFIGAFESATTFLMVGTLEPRKGHALALDAFDLLWSEGGGQKLLVIGKPGWKSEELILRINTHPHLGVNLVYMDSATDEELAYSYANANALLSISEAEGFGLPNIEAASYGLPILARDIDVFREVCGEGAYYLPNDLNSGILAQHLQTWIELAATGNAPSSFYVKMVSWRTSALELINAMNVKI
jgi:glycosyltransferase involved in cell wall biosynthesis